MFDLIVNPMARRGTGVKEVQKAADALDAKGLSYNLHYTQYVKHANEIAYFLTINGADTIISCGGDGTHHEVVNGIIKARLELEKAGKKFVTKLGLLPCGTGNDFMRSANMSINTINALDTIIKGNPTSIDAINIDGIYEICFACRGIDVDVVNMVNSSKKKTKYSYQKMILKCVFKRINYDFCIQIDDLFFKEKGVCAAVINGKCLASGMNFCPPAYVDDGFLDFIFIKKKSIIKMLFGLAKMKGDNFIDGDLVTHYRAKHAVISTNQESIDIDGELYDNKKFDAVIAPNIITLIK